MVELFHRRHFLTQCLVGLAGTSLTGCGTFLYPERRGQPGGQIDWKVVALDGIGLVLFFIPGVIAFAVDIYSGAIYLPPHEYSGTDKPTMREGFVSLLLPKEQISSAAIERTIAQHTGKQIQLDAPTCRKGTLKTLHEFDAEFTRLQQTENV